MTTLKTHPAELDLALYAGDGFAMAFRFSTDAGGVNPYPTPGVWTADIRSCVGGDVITSFTVVNDDVDGVVTISLTGEQTASLWPSAVYDLQQQAPDAEPRTWYRGAITIEGDVTRG
jgi:hypothetical protein